MEDERGWSRRFLIEDQEKVPIETMIMIATSAAIGMRLTRSPSTRIRNRSNTPAREGRQAPAPAGFHVDHRLADHRAAGHAADEAGDGVGDALADAFAVLVRRRVGQVVDDLGGHQAFEQTDGRDADGIGQDDLQRFERERNVGEQEHRQGVGQLAHVADGADVEPMASATAVSTTMQISGEGIARKTSGKR